MKKRVISILLIAAMMDEINGILKERGYEAEGLHGDLSQNQRDTVMNLFRNGRCAILIATDVAARGIDVSGVDAVFNYDVPEDIEYYVHRIGRTGRAGRKGRSFTLISGREIFKIRDIERICHTTIRERKIPTPADITRVKTGKLFVEAMEVMEQKDLSDAKRSIQQAAEENGFSVLDLAAAFMQMNIGDEPEEIKEEKPYLERRRAGRGDRAGKNGRIGRSDRTGRNDRIGRNGRADKTGRSEKSGRMDRSKKKEKPEKNTRTGRGSRGEKSERGFLSKKAGI